MPLWICPPHSRGRECSQLDDSRSHEPVSNFWLVSSTSIDKIIAFPPLWAKSKDGPKLAVSSQSQVNKPRFHIFLKNSRRISSWGSRFCSNVLLRVQDTAPMCMACPILSARHLTAGTASPTQCCLNPTVRAWGFVPSPGFGPTVKDTATWPSNRAVC